MRRFRFLLPVVVATSAGTFANAAEPEPERADLRKHQVERIRIFYRLTGPDAVKAADTNRNGIPDQVEDVMIQTHAAWNLFVTVLGYPDPFLSERYRSASFLDIHLRHRDAINGNGVAFDELQRFNRPGDPPGTLSLSFHVATSVDPAANLTPAHEFFHVLQNSLTFFKNRWFTEGTARWSERGLGLGALGPIETKDTLPLAPEKAEALFALAYDAAGQFWNGAAAACDPDDTIPASAALDELAKLTYAGGTPVLKDRRLTGWRFVRDVLLALGEADDVAFRELGYERWTEDNQKSPRNNPFILETVRQVAERHRGTQTR